MYIRPTLLSLALFALPATAITPTELFQDGKNTVMIKGVEVRKGTIAASIANAQDLNRLLNNPTSDPFTINAILDDQRSLIQGLLLVDILLIQPLESWFKHDYQQGRILLGVLMLQQDKTLLNHHIQDRLEEIKNFAHPILVAEMDKVFAY